MEHSDYEKGKEYKPSDTDKPNKNTVNDLLCFLCPFFVTTKRFPPFS